MMTCGFTIYMYFLMCDLLCTGVLIIFRVLQIEVQYLHDHAISSTIAIDVSATIGTPSVAFGTEASYMVPKYNAGFSLKKSDAVVSAILWCS